MHLSYRLSSPSPKPPDHVYYNTRDSLPIAVIAPLQHTDDLPENNYVKEPYYVSPEDVDSEYATKGHMKLDVELVTAPVKAGDDVNLVNNDIYSRGDDDVSLVNNDIYSHGDDDVSLVNNDIYSHVDDDVSLVNNDLYSLDDDHGDVQQSAGCDVRKSHQDGSDDDSMVDNDIYN